MIGNGTRLQVSDNSGAKIAECINESGRSWGVGETITVAIKKAAPRGKVGAGQVHKAVITEVKKEFSRRDGSLLKFAKNACVLINNKGQPIGTRVLGFATHELRARGMLKYMVSRDAVSLGVMGVVGLGTLSAVILTSQWKKEVQQAKEAWQKQQEAAVSHQSVKQQASPRD